MMFKPTEFPCKAWYVSHGLNTNYAVRVQILRPSEYPDHYPANIGPIWQNELFKTAAEADKIVRERKKIFKEILRSEKTKTKLAQKNNPKI